MTINNDSRRNRVNGNDSRTSFSYPFKVTNSNQITVDIADANNENPRTLVEGSDYTVNNVGFIDGGTIDYPITGSPLPTGWSITLRLNPERLQQTAFNYGGPYNEAIHEDAFDYLTRIILSQQEEIDRCLKIAPVVGDYGGDIYDEDLDYDYEELAEILSLIATGVSRAEAAADEAEDSAEASEANASASQESAEVSGSYNSSAQASADSAAAAATLAAASASTAVAAAAAAEAALIDVDAAEASALAAAESATNAANSAAAAAASEFAAATSAGQAWAAKGYADDAAAAAAGFAANAANSAAALQEYAEKYYDIIHSGGTSPTTYTNLSLVSYVGSQSAIVMLEIENNGALDQYYFFKSQGEPKDVTSPLLATNIGGGASCACVSPGELAYVMVQTSNDGVLEWKTGVSHNCIVRIYAGIKLG